MFDIEEFVDQYDAGGMNAPLGLEFMSRDEEMGTLKEKIMNNDLVVVSGASGIGKTKLVLEAYKQMRDEYCIGYIYWYWHYVTGEFSKEIYKQAPVKVMKQNYEGIYMMTPEEVVEMLKENN